MTTETRLKRNTKWMLPVMAVAVLAGCSSHQAIPAAPAASSAASTSTAAPAPATVTIAPATVTVTAPPPPPAAPSAPSPQPLGACSDDDLSVSNGTMQSADTQRHVALSFINISSHPCTLVGYPGADLVTPVGGLLIHVARRPALAAHRVTLAPNDVATADVESYAVDTTTFDNCPRWGALVVTPPNDFTSHALNVDIPLCGATISSVD